MIDTKQESGKRTVKA